MEKIQKNKLNKRLIFLIIVMSIIITIIGIEIITLSLKIKNNEKMLDSYIHNRTNYKYYSIDDNKFLEINVENESLIGDKCASGCNLKVNNFGFYYYYMITKNDEGYKLNIIKDNRVILSSKNLGYSIDSAYFLKYKGYISLYNKIEDGNYVYDYAVLCDEEYNIDEFTSFESDELEFTADGIIYYYDTCDEEGSHKIKAIRMPFNISPKVLDKEAIDLTWC